MTTEKPIDVFIDGTRPKVPGRKYLTFVDCPLPRIRRNVIVYHHARVVVDITDQPGVDDFLDWRGTANPDEQELLELFCELRPELADRIGVAVVNLARTLFPDNS